MRMFVQSVKESATAHPVLANAITATGAVTAAFWLFFAPMPF